MKVWYVDGKPYTDIEDAAAAAVASVGHHARTIYESTHDDAQAMIYKEALVTLKEMYLGDQHDFMGVSLSIGSYPC